MTRHSPLISTILCVCDYFLAALFIAVDGSPSYFYDSYEWLRFSGNEGCSEPRVILPSHIYHLNPRVKIILIFRHPVQRYSKINYNPFKIKDLNLRELLNFLFGHLSFIPPLISSAFL